MTTPTQSLAELDRSHAALPFDPHRALRRFLLVCAIIAAAYLAMSVLSTGLAYANVLSTSTVGNPVFWLSGWLALAALVVAVVAGEFSLLIPLALPPLVVAAAAAFPKLTADVQERGIEELYPESFGLPYFRVAVAIGLIELIAVVIIVAASFFYVAAGHRWADGHRHMMTRMFMGTMLMAVAASALILVR
jgi:hypothetical protein